MHYLLVETDVTTMNETRKHAALESFNQNFAANFTSALKNKKDK